MCCRKCFSACCGTCLKSTDSFTNTRTKSFIQRPFCLAASLTRASLRKYHVVHWRCLLLLQLSILPVPTFSYCFLFLYSRWSILTRISFPRHAYLARKVFQGEDCEDLLILNMCTLLDYVNVVIGCCQCITHTFIMGHYIFALWFLSF